MLTKKKKKNFQSNDQQIKSIDYLNLENHRKWKNSLDFLFYLKVIHQKSESSINNLDQILNIKWFRIQRSQKILNLNQIHHEDIRIDFFNQFQFIDSNYRRINNELIENENFIQKIFSHCIETIDRILFLNENLQFGEKQIYESRLDLIKNEYIKEEKLLKNLFLHQELSELNNQIQVLQTIELNKILHENIQFQFEKQKIKEDFFKQTHSLEIQSKKNFDQMKLKINQLNLQYSREIISVSKSYQRLLKKNHFSKQKLDQELRMISILEKKIYFIKDQIQKLKLKRIDLNDKIKQSKKCLQNQRKKYQRDQFLINPEKMNPLRRLCILTDKTKLKCQQKLVQAENLLLLIDQCRRLETENEILSKFYFHLYSSQTTNEILLKIQDLCQCHLPSTIYFEQCKSIQIRITRVQIDLFLLTQMKISQKKEQNLLRSQLKIFL